MLHTSPSESYVTTENAQPEIQHTTTMAAKRISEDTEVKLDIKTIGLLVGGVMSLASMWFTLQGEIQELNNKIDNFGSEEFVQKMEFQLKDELVRSTIIQIEKSTEVLKEDILDNKQSIKELENKVYKR